MAKKQDDDNKIGIVMLVAVIALAILFPGKTGGMWIFGLIPLAGFAMYFFYGASEAKDEFKDNPLKAIAIFLLIVFLGSGLLGLALILFGFI